MKKHLHSILTSIFPVFLVAVFPLLFFYVNNISQLSLVFLKLPLIISLTGSILLLILFYWLLRDINKSILITCVFDLIFFSYGHISKYFNDFLFIPLPRGFVIGPDKVMLPTVFLLFIFIFYKTLKTKKDLSQPIFFIKITLFLLCLNSLIPIVKTEVQRSKVENNTIKVGIKQVDMSVDYPDVYHIILDGYAGNNTLKDIYNYDNGDFYAKLEKMGFFVAKQAKSNYMHTYLSLPSTFNMTYLDSLPEKYGKKPVDDSAATKLMINNQVFQKFRSMGYKTYNFVSDWAGTNENYPADIIYSESKFFKIFGLNILTSESNMVFLKTTLLSPLIQEVWENALRKKTLSVFEKMPDIPYQEGKKYVLAHIMSPHPPYVFTEDGDEVNNPNLNNADEGVNRRPYYLAQLKFITMQTLPMLNRLINNSKKPPIIILQSDHGPGSIFGTRKDWKSNYNQLAVEERSNILYAVFMPDKKYDQFSNTMTPINTYRILFNKYFKDTYQLLPDRTYYTNYDEIYGFYDVTKK